MKNTSTTKPDALDKFLQELDEKMQAEGYKKGLIVNMRNDPAMMDILMRMIGAELKASKKARKDADRELLDTPR